MTLVELLVVITILTTLVAGVIPILSPNNDVRKLREASRAVRSFISSAQSEAARVGRPHGIAIRESAPGSGAALELVHLETPPPFAGFSEYSFAVVSPFGAQYGQGAGYNGGEQFLPRFQDAQLYEINLVLNGNPDPFPPRMLRIGDEIEIDGNRFLIVDDDDRYSAPNRVETLQSNYDIDYLYSDTSTGTSQLVCIWLNDPYASRGYLLPQGLNSYKIYRQPTTSMEPPLQLPSGIAVDMMASGVEGEAANISMLQKPTPPLYPGSFYEPRQQQNFDPARINDVGILFAANGAIERIYVNGVQTNNFNRVLLLLGRVENVLPDPDDYDFSTVSTNNEIETRRERVNWLNGDSRWIGISATTGRVVATENPQTDPTLYSGLDKGEQRIAQIRASREFVREMRQLGPN